MASAAVRGTLLVDFRCSGGGAGAWIFWLWDKSGIPTAFRAVFAAVLGVVDAGDDESDWPRFPTCRKRVVTATQGLF